MKYKYLKGSEKDFEGAPEWAELVYMGDVRCFVGRNGRWKNEGSILSFNEFAAQLTIGKMPKLIAERQPITESSWDGAGMPPVGCECEAMIHNPATAGCAWRKVKVVHVGEPGSKTEALVFDMETTYPSWADELRPLRSEADNKRDAAIRAIDDWLPEYTTDNPSLYHATAMYDAIAAGSIPGVKLED